MAAPLRLVIFDVDGTLVDSQADIVSSMASAFQAAGMQVPDRTAILGIVGLSLDVAMKKLAPDADTARMVATYKDAYAQLRLEKGAASSPLYPGARAVLDHFAAQDDTLLGVATGKSRRGLDSLIECHGLEGLFVTRQVADFHPSKPDPSMILTALDETGVGREDAVMVGDTSFDMDMAHHAGVCGIGVTWGYHPRARLHRARHVIEQFADLPATVDRVWGAYG